MFISINVLSLLLLALVLPDLRGFISIWSVAEMLLVLIQFISFAHLMSFDLMHLERFNKHSAKAEMPVIDPATQP